MDTEEVKNVPGLNPEDVVVIRKIGFKSMRKIRNTIKTSVTGETSIPIGDLQLAYMVYGIKSAPFFPSEDEQERFKIIDSDDFSIEVVDFLYPKIAALNNHQSLQELKKK